METERAWSVRRWRRRGFSLRASQAGVGNVAKRAGSDEQVGGRCAPGKLRHDGDATARSYGVVAEKLGSEAFPGFDELVTCRSGGARVQDRAEVLESRPPAEGHEGERVNGEKKHSEIDRALAEETEHTGILPKTDQQNQGRNHDRNRCYPERET
jgi:hypothetical protein